MTVVVEETPPPDWDLFVSKNSVASHYHRSDWLELCRRVFKVKIWYLTSRLPTGEIDGVLPLVDQKSLIFGRFLTSVSYFNYGGPLFSESATLQALLDAAGELGTSLGVRHIELRTQLARLSDWQPRTDKIAMLRELPATVDELSKQLGAKLRSQIKRIDRESPEVLLGGVDRVADFYYVFSRNMRDLGTPVYAKSFFAEIAKSFPGIVEIVVVRLRDEPVAAAFLVHGAETTEIPWAACLTSAKPLGANMKLYWECLSAAIRRGSKTFDFGRSSKDAGTFKFKQQWGAKPEQLYWYYRLPGGAELPQLHHGNPRLQAAISVWRKLPLWFCNLVGPSIVRNLP